MVASAHSPIRHQPAQYLLSKAGSMNSSKSMTRNVFRFALAAIAGCLGACAGSDGTSAPVPSRLVLSVEPPSSASSGVVLTPAPGIQVVDADGAPIGVNGILVTASLASGSGSVVGTVGVRTDQGGRAVFTDLILSGPVGSRTLRFSAPGLSAVVSRSIEVGSGPVSTAVISAGNSQTTAAGTPVPVAPAVRVTDGADNPVPGIRVSFAVTAGGGSVTGAQPLTNAQGIATVGQWTMGTAIGQNALSATIDGIATPLTFQATATVGPVAHIELVEGDGQTATIGAAVAIPPAVKVSDAFGNIITGLSVNFSIASGGGTVTGGAPISDVNGIARLGSWRLGLVPGANTLSASRDNATPLLFTATATDLSVVSIAAGTAHSCAVGADNVTRCWGDNRVGQLGNGTLQSDSVAVTVSSATAFTQVVAGDGHSCGLTAGGQAWCWGFNANGELGNGTTSTSPVPKPVSGGLTFTQISSSASHTCALDANGAAWCWGNGASGRLGDGATTSRTTPRAVVGGNFYSRISAGVEHTCAVRRDDGVLFCWGSNGSGRLGDGTTTQHSTPTPVSGTTVFTSVAAGAAFTCGLDNQSEAWCWGANASGQLGTGTTTPQTVPTRVTGTRSFTTIVTSTAHTCAIEAVTAAAWCWGENAGGRLGDGTTTDRFVPTAVLGGALHAALSAGDQDTCARTTSGSAICWGNNSFGQLGDGTRVGRAAPVGVKRP